jgi:hypothetical protein
MTTLFLLLAFYLVLSYSFLFGLFSAGKIRFIEVAIAPVLFPITIAIILNHKKQAPAPAIQFKKFANITKENADNMGELIQDVNEYMELRDVYKGEADIITDMAADDLLRKYLVIRRN